MIPRWKPKPKRDYQACRFISFPRSYGMTVCIAALAKDETIVTASDMKVSVGHTSSDVVMLKIEPVHPFWHVMIAGAIAQKFPILDIVRERLKPIPRPSASEIRGVASAAYAEYGQLLATESVLSRIGLTMKDFLAKREQIGDLVFQQLIADISRITVGCDLLFVGHDNNNSSHIIGVSNPTPEHPSFTTEYPSFAAIGSGGYLADTILHSLRHYAASTLEEAVYHVACAKFMAESASDVGETTYISVIYPDGSHVTMYPDFIDKKLRKIWETKVKPRIYNNVLPEIREEIENPSGRFPAPSDSKAGN
jgi:ATP-dependent protease HslVU (ClpYQ) peptidase subunit